MHKLIDAQSKALRLKSVRSLSGLTRKQLEKQHGISENTLRMWEQPRSGSNGLTVKGAERMIEALNKTGVLCTIDWLLSGIGQGPMLYQQLHNEIIKPLSEIVNVPEFNYNQEELAIQQEIQLFEKLYKNSIVIRVADNAMQPFVAYGDYVGGYRKEAVTLDDLVGHLCIIKLKNEMILCRKLLKNNEKFILSSINENANIKNAIEYDPDIEYAYPISWVRKLYLN